MMKSANATLLHTQLVSGSTASRVGNFGLIAKIVRQGGNWLSNQAIINSALANDGCCSGEVYWMDLRPSGRCLNMKATIDPFDYWRLCDQLTVVQAALLVIGSDPSSDASYVEGWQPENRPPGYEATKTAISNALRSGRIAGKTVCRSQWIWNELEDTQHQEEIEGSFDFANSIIEVESLKNWLAERGFTTGFFFPQDGAAPDYLDPQHPRYAPKLAAAIRAWLATGSESLSGRSPKQVLVKWLRQHAAELGLSDEDGKPNESGIEEIAKVANWQLGGGAPKTPGG